MAEKKRTTRTQKTEAVAANYVDEEGNVVDVDGDAERPREQAPDPQPVIEATVEEGAVVAGGTGTAESPDLPRPWRTEIFGAEGDWGWRVVAANGTTVKEVAPSGEFTTPLQAERDAAKDDAGQQSSRVDSPRS